MADAVARGKKELVPDKARLKLFSIWLTWRLVSELNPRALTCFSFVTGYLLL